MLKALSKSVLLFLIAPILVELRPTKELRQNMLDRGRMIYDVPTRIFFIMPPPSTNESEEDEEEEKDEDEDETDLSSSSVSSSSMSLSLYATLISFSSLSACLTLSSLHFLLNSSCSSYLWI